MIIRRAYQLAVERLRNDPHFALPVPTLLEVAAQYRRVIPGARINEIRAELAHAALPLADADAATPTREPRERLVA